MRTRRTLGALAAVAGLLLAACGGAKEREAVSAALEAALQARTRPAYVTADAEGRKLWKLTQQFYERRRHAPAWIEGTHPGPQVVELLSAIQTATDEGLDPQLYNLDLLEQRRKEASSGFLTKKGFEPAAAGAIDVWFTYLYMKYASDLADGVSDLAHADPAWQIKPEKFAADAQLERALESGDVARSLTGLPPAHYQYQALRRTLGEYRAALAAGGWPKVPAKLRVSPGQRRAGLADLARRLRATGDFDGRIPDTPAAVYGPDLQAAVKRFQRRHGLAENGVVDAAVVAEMNVPLERRIEQIALNLERWRWLPRDLGDRHIVVNIPEYRLEVWERDRVALAMRVVVGRQESPTPIFDDEMSYVVFSPYWNVPPDIARDETLPEVMRDPAFLQRTNMEVVDAKGNVLDPASIDLTDPEAYRFRQRPGADNSLGLVKFMFPNQYNVYLHDTPSDSLFARTTRSFSHGCVRVEQPMALARYVLADQPDWTETRISEAMEGGEERTVKLRKPIPVYLVYWTARTGADGSVQFLRDAYGIDKRQRALLGERLMRLRKSAAAAARAAARPPATGRDTQAD